MSVKHTEPSTAPRSKAVLFCPHCGHESHVDGDWIVMESRGETEIECPDCGTTVETRSNRKPLHCF